MQPRRTFQILALVLIATTLSACAVSVPSLPMAVFGRGGPCSTGHPVLARLQGCVYLDESQMGKPFSITRENANDRVANTCLLELAASFGDIEVLTMLIENGANPQLCAKGFEQRMYRDPIHRACNEFRRTDMEPLFAMIESLGIRAPNIQDVLATAARQGCVSAVKYSIARGADLNLPDGAGFRPLHYAANSATEMKIGTVAFLRRAGADPNLPASNGETPCDQAKRLLSAATNWPRMEAALSSCFATKP